MKFEDQKIKELEKALNIELTAQELKGVVLGAEELMRKLEELAKVDVQGYAKTYSVFQTTLQNIYSDNQNEIAGEDVEAIKKVANNFKDNYYEIEQVINDE